MTNFATFIKRYALSWAMVLCVRLSLAFALGVLFGPALAAIIVAAVIEGRAGVKALLARAVQWRVGWQWYDIAIGLPVFVALFAVIANKLLGGQMPADASGSLDLTMTLALLVVGEELGWRGFALPRLQARHSSLVASLILGALWACWHLANATILGLGYYLTAFPAFLLYVLTMSVLFTWIANHTHDSVLLSWLFHAAGNVSGALFFIGDQSRQWWLSGAGFALLVLIVVAVVGPNLARQAVQPLAPAAQLGDAIIQK